MSAVLVIQRYDKVFIGSDTAISAKISDNHYRTGNNGRKLFHIDNKVIFCSGNLEESYRIMNEYKRGRKRDLYHLQNTAKKIHKQYKTDDLIEIIVVEKQDDRVLLYQIPSYSDFEIIEIKIKKGDISMYSGGIKTEECFDIALSYFKVNYSINDIYMNTFNKLSYECIGGDLILYEINLKGIRKILNVPIKENKPFKFLNIKLNLPSLHCIVAKNLYGQVIGSSKLAITNTKGSFIVDGDKMTATDMILSLNRADGKSKILIDPENGIKIQNNSSGNWQDKFYADTEGNLVLDGKQTITNDGITLIENYKNANGGLMQIFDTSGNLNVKIGSENGTASNKGGTLVLYDDSIFNPKVELGISTTYEAAAQNMKDRYGNVRVAIYADSNIGNGLFLRGEDGLLKSYIKENVGKIANNEILHSGNWSDYVDLSNYAKTYEISSLEARVSALESSSNGT